MLSLKGNHNSFNLEAVWKRLASFVRMFTLKFFPDLWKFIPALLLQPVNSVNSQLFRADLILLIINNLSSGLWLSKNSVGIHTSSFERAHWGYVVVWFCFRTSSICWFFTFVHRAASEFGWCLCFCWVRCSGDVPLSQAGRVPVLVSKRTQEMNKNAVSYQHVRQANLFLPFLINLF